MPEERMPKELGAVLLSGPSKAVEPNEKEQGREDQLQAFADFTDETLPESERMDALAFFVELVQSAGPTEIDEE